ncbi:hypothetical protein KC19_8G006500 [Ceratodon purpureus]|uniref:ubiquitinyl hydrolase 1 n=2 Tax=Ceratodon purpureus TaxID=3225 RepID=A0A8T0GVS0_CERPU|nr:hypothetical protein KC19_8G006500 [Ceratodon purpureus]
MDTLRSHLPKVRIPEPSSRIYKQECCVSFSTPRSEGGLFVDMYSFLAFGREYVMWNYEKTRNPVYLNIQETPKQVSEDRPHKKPTLLAIGVEGGFDSKEPEYEVSYSIVILPEFISLSYPSVELPEKVRLAVDAVLAAVGAERKEEVAAWTADKKQVSPFALSLQQLENGVKVPPSGWKCSQCDKTENLWMNLTDGTILCGRRNWDGTGGNNHALEHYQATNYPLAVKLGTITADLEGADVYSYAEDDTVEDPLLADHLAHFGIDFSSLRKTEMTTAERELDQNTNFDWNRIQEKGKELEPLFGPGFTGLANLGNSCYLASVMQAVFATKDFQRYYYENVKLDDAFKQAPADPTLDLHMQLSDEEIVRPRVPLAACLESFYASEEVQDFYSSAINARTTAIKTTRLATFPDYLVLHMRKFVLAAGWVPKKLDVFVDVPDEIDISNMRSNGMQPDEQLLPETPEEIPEQAGPVADEAIVSQLLDIGFSKVRCEKAAIQTLNTGVEEAMNWLLAHMDDPDIDEPITASGNRETSSAVLVNESDVETLVAFGFLPEMARKALRATVGDVGLLFICVIDVLPSFRI